jgi:hypothetical protein
MPVAHAHTLHVALKRKTRVSMLSQGWTGSNKPSVAFIGAVNPKPTPNFPSESFKAIAAHLK